METSRPRLVIPSNDYVEIPLNLRRCVGGKVTSVLWAPRSSGVESDHGNMERRRDFGTGTWKDVGTLGHDPSNHVEQDRRFVNIFK